MTGVIISFKFIAKNINKFVKPKNSSVIVATKTIIEDLVSQGVQFSTVGAIVQLLPAPLPRKIGDEVVNGPADLFRSSHLFGFNELFFPYEEWVFGTSAGVEIQVSRDDFLIWQISKFNDETLYYLRSKTECNIFDMFDEEDEVNRDESYDPRSWMNVYDADQKENGLKFVRRLRQEMPGEFYARLAASLADQRVGITDCLETEIWQRRSGQTNIDEVREQYKNWPIPLSVVVEGEFSPYIEAGHSDNLMCDDVDFDSMYIRNNDEGDVAA